MRRGSGRAICDTHHRVTVPFFNLVTGYQSSNTEENFYGLHKLLCGYKGEKTTRKKNARRPTSANVGCQFRETVKAIEVE